MSTYLFKIGTEFKFKPRRGDFGVGKIRQVKFICKESDVLCAGRIITVLGDNGWEKKS